LIDFHHIYKLYGNNLDIYTYKKMHHSKHSKFKNTGILFEILTHQITADILSGKDNSKAQCLLFKYFKEDTEMGKEWKLYNFLLTEKIKDINHAERYISVILDQRRKLNNSKLLREKYELIKDIKNTYPIESLLKSNVKNYRTMASIYKVFENVATNNDKFNVNEVYESRNCIIEHIIDKPKKLSNEEELIKFYEQQNVDIRLLSYKLLAEGMNKKYSILDENQKEILKEYINSVSNTNHLNEFITDKLNKIKTELNELVSSINDDVIKIKINEVIHQIGSVKIEKVVKDHHIMAALLGWELIKEIKNNLKENEKKTN
jgi:hypothetical protein